MNLFMAVLSYQGYREIQSYVKPIFKEQEHQSIKDESRVLVYDECPL